MSESPLHVRWASWDRTSVEQFSLRWDNGGWVAEGEVSGVDIQYVMRFGPDLDLRQFLLFRDLEEPDLWLVTDGSGRWGEMNGGEREDLRGCTTVSLGCSPSMTLAAVRGLGLAVGEEVAVEAATVDVETLSVVPATHTFRRLGDRQWHLSVTNFGFAAAFDVDADGVLLDAPGWFTRLADPT